ncbi:MAG TPA: 50S ribosomal protein L22 [Cyclobacteriaceae bacterium]
MAEVVEKKTKRSVLKQEKIRARKEAARTGSVKVSLRNVPTSPRKMRLVADLVRGQRVSKALSLLKYESKAGAAKIEKLLLSAIASWEAKNPDGRIEEADLYISGIWVDSGRILKRLRPAPQGRAHRIRKRSNHVTLVLDSMNKASATEAVEEEKETKE